jgi:hypothetical protein
LRAALDPLGGSYPALDWGLSWLADHCPDRAPYVLTHRDWRTGNLMLREGALEQILDWEFADWSDGYEDIGWLSAPCWCFTRRDRPLGGFGAWGAFAQGYWAQSGEGLDPARLHFWQVLALVRWAIIALRQGQRFRPSQGASLEFGLTAWRLPELCWEILQRTPPDGDVGQRSATAHAGMFEGLPAPADLRRAALLRMQGDARDGLARNALGLADRARRENGALLGAFEGTGNDLHAALVAQTRAWLAISNPRYLADLER